MDEILANATTALANSYDYVNTFAGLGDHVDEEPGTKLQGTFKFTHLGASFVATVARGS